LQAQKRAKIHQRKQRRARRARQKVREETDERSGDRH
jgi:hypothetical protein